MTLKANIRMQQLIAMLRDKTGSTKNVLDLDSFEKEDEEMIQQLLKEKEEESEQKNKRFITITNDDADQDGNQATQEFDING